MKTTILALIAASTLTLAVGCASSSSPSTADDSASNSSSSEGALVSSKPAFDGSFALASGQDDEFLALYFNTLEIKPDGSFKGQQAAPMDGGDGNIETGVADISGKTSFTAGNSADEGTVAFSYTVDGKSQKDVFVYKQDGSKIHFIYSGAVLAAVGKRNASAYLKKSFADIADKVGGGNVFTLVSR